jgi:hypothetical protein
MTKNRFTSKAVRNALAIIILIAVLFACTNDNPFQPITESKTTQETAIEMYARYLNGEIYDSAGETISELDFNIERFCIYDLENDGVPELYISLETTEGSFQDVGWIRWENGVLHNDLGTISWVVLRDDGVLFREGPTVQGKTYWWKKFVDGEFKVVEFAQFDDNHDGAYDTFVFGSWIALAERDNWANLGAVEVTKEEWTTLTAPYFEVGEPIIEWVMWEDFNEWYAQQDLGVK